MSKKPENPLGMSDEEFLNLNSPTDVGEAEEESVEEQAQEDSGANSAEGEESEDSSPEASENEPEAEEDAEEGAEASDGDEPSGDEEAPEEADSEAEVAQEGAAEEETSEEKETSEEVSADTSVDYKTFYEKVMTPFKANGKTIELRSPEEAIQLMQMGANYTKKMQDIQPYRKVLMMLQNNDLVDEGKLSFLIDLERKDPEAIKKLLKDSGVDPMDIDTDSESSYQGGRHAVSDEQAQFQEILEDVGSSDGGRETLSLIDKNWDDASKEALWQSPQIMQIIHQQRQSGVYDLITAEIDRKRALGQLPAHTPFLEAYRNVGAELQSANGTETPANEHTGQPAPTAPAKEPIARRAAVPKSTVKDGDKASAAATPRGSSRTRKEFKNPLAMSDDEFLKQMENRV